MIPRSASFLFYLLSREEDTPRVCALGKRSMGKREQGLRRRATASFIQTRCTCVLVFCLVFFFPCTPMRVFLKERGVVMKNFFGVMDASVYTKEPKKRVGGLDTHKILRCAG